jgi:hypothetical protein
MGRTLQEVIESLLAAQRAAVEARAADLIRSNERRQAEDRLEALRVEGLRGEEGELTDSDWSDIRNEALAQLRPRQKKR